MSKNPFSNPAFQNESAEKEPTKFNMVNQTPIPFNSVFKVGKLPEEEEIFIQELLRENFKACESQEGAEEEKLVADCKRICELTTEIKSIQRQSIVLLGERIEQARNILKSYKDRTFTLWLIATVKSKQTGYNLLSYYQFYQSLPVDLKESFKKIPQKAAYVLANRKGGEQEKFKIVEECHSIPPKEIIKIVQDTFPISSKDRRKRKVNDAEILESIHANLIVLKDRKDELDKASRDQLNGLCGLIEEILDYSKQGNIESDLEQLTFTDLVPVSTAT